MLGSSILARPGSLPDRDVMVATRGHATDDAWLIARESIEISCMTAIIRRNRLLATSATVTIDG
ncbi:hypothetical protein DCE93_04890 [Agromyces badenianii]|uniref:Uncharacterized protein n=1 Tax=Agromyces badenianii TaxID=2080742 RepID=A0A2S0WUQ2_9MICO|nr:hypothetical protein DCE93_04890 [Agromyces badenianii]PWC03155.1 hypothetical protein DCE94_12880 [Agromyces badenianii]